MNRDALPPTVLQAVGLVGLVSLGVFWAVTNRLNPTLLATMGGLVGLGQYGGAIRALTSSESPSALPPAPAYPERPRPSSP